MKRSKDRSDSSTDDLGAQLEDRFVDDDSWAQPQPTAGRGLRFLAVALSAVLVATGGFIAGAKIGKDRAQSTSPFAAFARGGFGGAGGFGGGGFGGGGFGGGGFGGGGAGGFGAGGGGFGAGRNGGGRGVTAATQPPDLGGLLPGVPAAPSADTGSATSGADATAPTSGEITGKVVRIDGESIVVDTGGGQEVTVRADATTKFERKATALRSDVEVGTTISVTSGDSPDAAAARVIVGA